MTGWALLRTTTRRPSPAKGLTDLLKSSQHTYEGYTGSPCSTISIVETMPLPFSAVCQLWERLSCARKTKDAEAAVQEWFRRHALDITRQGPGGLALLSCLFPHKRPDRVYGLREKKLTSITVKAWGLGSGRRNELQRLQDEDGLDFASAVQRIVVDGGEALQLQHSPTVEGVDATLDQVASTCNFSSAGLRSRIKEKSVDPSRELIGIFRRMSGLEVKWMIRLLLKDLGPVHLPEMVTMQLFHTALPQALEVRRSLAGALELLIPLIPEQEPDTRSTNVMQPRLETMISLPVFEKARSIRHCCQLVGDQEISVERKYDGEYCQVHVRTGTAGDSHVTIFSKSGRNSTMDRKPLLPMIAACLSMDTPDCRIQRQCILVGELLVWSDHMQEIMPFFKIRRHVSREGHQLGCDQDSPRSPDEHLMIIFYDVLVLDNINCIYEPYERRRQRLQELIRPFPGHAELGEREKMDFRRPDAAVHLAHRMANAITQNWEGLVLKACQDPYLSAHGGIQQHVKLKKDYIPGLGDSADLVVVGGRRDASAVCTLGLGNLSWTTFYLACVENKGAFLNRNAKPIFRIVCEVSRPSILMSDMRYLNQYGKSCQVPFTRNHSEMEVHTDLVGGKLPTNMFTRPTIVEVVGAGFDRPPNLRYDTLRFPRVVKIHHDRTVHDATDFAAYQLMAEHSRAHHGNEPQESYRFWLAKLGFDSTVKDSVVQKSPENSQNIRHSSSYPFAGSWSPDDLSQNETGCSARPLTKRKASDVSSQTSTHKRVRCLRPSEQEKIVSDHELIEIPETQPEVQASQLGCSNQDDLSLDSTSFSIALLVHPSLQSSLCRPNRDFMNTLSTCRVEVTFSLELFWDSIAQRARYPSSNGQLIEQPGLILVDWSHDNAVASMLEFMSSTLARCRDVLDVHDPCKVLFVEWEILKFLGAEQKRPADWFQKHILGFSAILDGKITVGGGSNATKSSSHVLSQGCSF